MLWRPQSWSSRVVRLAPGACLGWLGPAHGLHPEEGTAGHPAGGRGTPSTRQLGEREPTVEKQVPGERAPQRQWGWAGACGCLAVGGHLRPTSAALARGTPERNNRGLGLGETDPQGSVRLGRPRSRDLFTWGCGLGLLQRTKPMRPHRWRRMRSYEAAWAGRG